MNERYFGKIVSTPNKYTVIVDKGAEHGVESGDRFIVVGLGDVLLDPDTNEELERLEIVRGRVVVTHVQKKISTLTSCEYEKSEDVRDITKVTSRGGLAMLGPQETITESIRPGEKRQKALDGAVIGDYLIKIDDPL